MKKIDWLSDELSLLDNTSDSVNVMFNLAGEE